MPKWIHERADHIRAKNPDMPRSQAFAIATQQSYAAGKAPKKYGTREGRHEAHVKYDEPRKEYKKTADPGNIGTKVKEAIALPNPLTMIKAPKVLGSALTLGGKGALAGGAVGAGIGAAGGALSAKPGNRLQGALSGAGKGALIGGSVGGVGGAALGGGTAAVVKRGLSNPASFSGRVLKGLERDRGIRFFNPASQPGYVKLAEASSTQLGLSGYRPPREYHDIGLLDSIGGSPDIIPPEVARKAARSLSELRRARAEKEVRKVASGLRDELRKIAEAMEQSSSATTTRSLSEVKPRSAPSPAKPMSGKIPSYTKNHSEVSESPSKGLQPFVHPPPVRR